ncbi:MAG: hypothetical protein ACO3KY_11755 [Lysobacterales bacterium]|jgi:hypothetical protein
MNLCARFLTALLLGGLLSTALAQHDAATDTTEEAEENEAYQLEDLTVTALCHKSRLMAES